jgi:hypothetical protein
VQRCTRVCEITGERGRGGARTPRLMTRASGTQDDQRQVLSTFLVASVRVKIEGIVVLPPQQLRIMPRPDQAAVWTCASVSEQAQAGKHIGKAQSKCARVTYADLRVA